MATAAYSPALSDAMCTLSTVILTFLELITGGNAVICSYMKLLILTSVQAIGVICGKQINL